MSVLKAARLSKKPPLNRQELWQLDAYWRAANYLTACQLYLLDNPLLERPLTKSDLKQTIVGHWGTCPGQNFIYTHLNRVIKRDDLDMIYLSGPGHGGNAMVAQDWLDGSYTEVYPNITRDEEGMQKLFKRFSFPGGIPSHVAPGDPRLHPRGRRAGLLPGPRLRRRGGQSRSDRRLRGGRRRGGDRPAGHLVARQQVHEPHHRRRGAAHSAPQRLQDRQPHHLLPHEPRGGRELLPRLRLGAALRRGR